MIYAAYIIDQEDKYQSKLRFVNVRFKSISRMDMFNCVGTSYTV